MKKTLAFFVFLSIFSGCAHNPSSVKIIFTNQSDNLTHLTISNGSDSVQLTAKENNSETKDLRFERVPKTDGHYHIHIKTIGKDTTFNWGYYTNGYPFEKSINIVYKKDTTILKSDSYE
jgi:hypothetical protein